MYFRFGSALVLVVLVSVVGIALEKQNLELRRAVSRQHFRMDVLRDTHAELRLQTQQLGAPARVIEALESGSLSLKPPEAARVDGPRQMPLLRWQRPTAEQ
jgi:hypothetical protein